MKVCEAGRSSGCCKNPDIRTINTMNADTDGNFEIRAGTGVGITTETNGIRIAYTGGIVTYTNNDGNLDIDNANFTIDLANDIDIAGDLSVANDAEVNGDTTLNGDLSVNGNIYNQGASYESHMEQVYTEDDYIIMRDNAVTGLAAGDFSGFQVKKYDGTNDGRLVIDNAGVARVGDVGDEQPLLTRDEAADLTDGQLFKWDAVNSKAVGITNNFTQGTGNIGSDLKPIKIVNGVATAVTNDLVSTSGDQTINGLKKFSSPVGVQSGQAYNRLTGFYVASNYAGYDLISGNPNATNTYGGIRVVFNQDTNAVSIELIKMVNGTFTSTMIATL